MANKVLTMLIVVPKKQIINVLIDKMNQYIVMIVKKLQTKE